MIQTALQYHLGPHPPEIDPPANWEARGSWMMDEVRDGETTWKRLLVRSEIQAPPSDEELPPGWEWAEFGGESRAVAARLPNSLSGVIVWWDGTVSASAGTPWGATMAAVRRARRLFSFWRPSH